MVVDLHSFELKHLSLQLVDDDVLLVVFRLCELIGPDCRLGVIQVLAVHLILNFIKSNKHNLLLFMLYQYNQLSFSISCTSDHLWRVPAHATGRQLHEFVPVVGLLAAAVPVLLEVVEDGLPLVVLARALAVVLVEVVLPASLVHAFELALLGHELLLLALLGRLLYFLLLLEF